MSSQFTVEIITEENSTTYSSDIPDIDDISIAVIRDNCVHSLEEGSEEDLACSSSVLSRFQLHKKLGEGKSGTVYLGKDSDYNLVAIKLISVASLCREGNRQLKTFNQEIESLIAVSHHPNVVSLVEWTPETNYEFYNGNQQWKAIVLEFAPNGELFNLVQSWGSLPEVLARTYAQQLLSALATCHSAGVAHRDIKPENLVLAEDYSLRLADFGLSLTGCRPGCTTPNTGTGTKVYMPPEVFCSRGSSQMVLPGVSNPIINQNVFSNVYDAFKADTWSAAVVIFILLVGHPPFEFPNRSDWYFRKILNANWNHFWAGHFRNSPDISLETKAFLELALCPRPADRPSVEDLLNDSWITKGPVLDEISLPEYVKMNERNSTEISGSA